MPVLAPSLERHWALFDDWCDALDKPKLPTTADTIVEFVQKNPTGVPTNTLRIRAIRRQHECAGAPLDLDALQEAATAVNVALRRPVSLVRSGDGLTRDVGEALAQLPRGHHGKSVAPALRARRDGFIIVLFGLLGFTREEIRRVTPADVLLDPLTIQGLPVQRGDDQATCPACAVTRWLRVVMPAELGFRNDVRSVLDPRAFDPDIHDCDEGLEQDWTHATTLVPAIDKHGWVDAHCGVSTRSVSAIGARVQQFTGHREQRWTPQEQQPTRFDGMSTKRFADEMDEFDRRVAQALARSAEVLADAHQTSNELYGLVNAKAG